MEQYGAEHQVPQNVTSFEFHLVGDMTLKQFGYLASGMIVAYIFFATILTSSPFIAVPLIIFSALCGVAFAFFPIYDRPLDHWVTSFFKAIYSPTQGAWQSPLTHNKPDPKDPAFHNRLQLFMASQGEAPIPVQELPKEVIPAQDTAQLAQMTQYIQQLEAKLAQNEKQVVAPPVILQTPKPAPVAVAAPQPQVYYPAQMVLTSQPNVINGVVTDSEGNYLDGVIISIYDKNNMPVRASKTNKLGQFSGASPLSDGIYTVSIEKENLDFDPLQVNLTGAILPPLTVHARKGAI